MEMLSNLSIIFVVVGVLAFVISVITEVTKNIGFLKSIPTDIQVIVLSIILTVLALVIYCQYSSIPVLWYYIVAAVILSFFVAFVAMYGWEKLTGMWERFKYEDKNNK